MDARPPPSHARLITFTCPHCGGRADCDLDRAALLARTEEREGRRLWFLYRRAVCGRCGRESLLLRRREELD